MTLAIAITMLFVAATSALGGVTAVIRWVEARRARDAGAAVIGIVMTGWSLFCAIWLLSK
ncbi:MAG TPA: hypothetical protein VHW02_07970 [Rhizomicrobium sp.]|nr:hypothetical protein [Rhizomicrobium sp.]